MKSVREGLVVILPRDEATVDVFTGIGWKTHTVFSVKGETLIKAKGPDIGAGPYNFVCRVLGFQRKEAA